MKSIIFIFIVMLLKPICQSYSPTEPRPCAENGYNFWTAKILVKTKSGDTCKSAMIEGVMYPQTFFANSTGYVKIDYKLPECSSCGESCFFKIYKDANDRTAWIIAGIKNTRSSGYPIYIFTFPNTP